MNSAGLEVQSRNGKPPGKLLEVCVEDCAGLLAAQAGGAGRVELCSALGSGGLTPSAGMIEFAAGLKIPAMVLVRPRSGDFIYGSCELEIMERDIGFAAKHHCAGVVIGAAAVDGSLDLVALERLRTAAGNMEVCLNRVFDLTPDPFSALERVIDLGFQRILTSGQEVSALAGCNLLAMLVEQAGARIEILGAGGISPGNVEELIQTTGLEQIHASCRSVAPPGSAELARFGFADAERGQTTNENMVRNMAARLNRLA